MLKAGIARCAITPPVGMLMIGYTARKGVAEGRDGELYATALVLDDEKTRVAILSFDLAFLLEPFVSNLRRSIGLRLGIPPSHVLVNCSHTHAGPALQKSQYDFEDEEQERLLEGYAAGFSVQLPALAAEAARKLAPARIGTSTGEARIGINRREEQPDGAIFLGENPGGPIDHEVRVIRVDDLTGRPIAVVFAHGCHTVSMGPQSLRWSADYIGPARDLVEANLSCPSLYLQANAGDVNPIAGIGSNVDDSDAKRRLGHMLGAEVLKVHSSIYTESERAAKRMVGSLARVPFYPRVPIQREPDSTIAVKEIPLELPLQQLPSRETAEEILRERESEVAKLWKAGADGPPLNIAGRYRHWAENLVQFIASGRKPALQASIQVIKIGDIAITAFPGETFSTLGLEVKRQSPFAHTLFLGYSNGCVCYIPTRDAFPKKGWSIRDPYYVPDQLFQAYLVPVALQPECGELVVERSVALLKEMAGGA